MGFNCKTRQPGLGKTMEPWMAWAAAHFAILSPDMAAAWGKLALTVNGLVSSTQAGLVRNSPARPIDQVSFEASNVRCMWPGVEVQIHAGRLGLKTSSSRAYCVGFSAWLIASLCRPGIWQQIQKCMAFVPVAIVLSIHPSRVHPPASWDWSLGAVHQD